MKRAMPPRGPRLLLLVVLASPLIGLLLLPAALGLVSLYPWGSDGAPSPDRVFNRVVLIAFVAGLLALRERIGWAQDLAGRFRWDEAGRRQLRRGTACSLLPLLALAAVLVAGGVWNWLPQPAYKVASRLPRYLLSAVVIAGLEETLFRGIILGAATRALGARAGLWITSAFFALVHPLGSARGSTHSAPLTAGLGVIRDYLHAFAEPLALRQMVGYLLVGVILAVATQRTGRLWFALGLHFGWVVFIRCDGLLLSRSKQWDPVYFGNNRLVDGVMIWLFLLAVYILTQRMLRREAASRC